jgi:hypothetical protein
MSRVDCRERNIRGDGKKKGEMGPRPLSRWCLSTAGAVESLIDPTSGVGREERDRERPTAVSRIEWGPRYQAPSTHCTLGHTHTHTDRQSDTHTHTDGHNATTTATAATIQQISCQCAAKRVNSFSPMTLMMMTETLRAVMTDTSVGLENQIKIKRRRRPVVFVSVPREPHLLEAAN